MAWGWERKPSRRGQISAAWVVASVRAATGLAVAEATGGGVTAVT